MVMKETVNASIKPSAENRAKIFNSPDFISIKQLTSTAKAAVESVTQTIAESQQEERLRTFNQQEFEEAWKDFTSKKLVNNALAQSAFQVALLKLNEDYSVEVSFPSTTQEYYFNDLKSQLAEFLKNEYRMNGITYRVLVQKSDEVRVSSVMSEKDKFEAMREKNPALEELRKRFGLEIPF
jgi:DNA polymerase-3 subunit gamma/tau